MNTRAFIISKFAKKIGIEADRYYEKFRNEENIGEINDLIVELAENMVSLNSDFIFKMAIDYAKLNNIHFKIEEMLSDSVRNMSHEIDQLCPVNCDDIAVLTNMFWDKIRNIDSWPIKMHNTLSVFEKFHYLNNIYFKSCEIAEISRM